MLKMKNMKSLYEATRCSSVKESENELYQYVAQLIIRQNAIIAQLNKLGLIIEEEEQRYY